VIKKKVPRLSFHQHIIDHGFFLLCFLAVCEEARREIYGFLLLLLCERENTREKKLKNRLNWKNRKKITEKPESWKKPIKLIKIFKKPTGSVRFYRPKTKKKPNWAKPKKTSFYSKITKLKPVGLNRFWFFLISLIISFNKNQTE